MKVSITCLLTMMGLMLSGCTITTAKAPRATYIEPEMAAPTTERNTIDYYTQKLANQLFASVITLKPSNGIAIGTFTEVDSLQLNPDTNHPLRLLGLQLEEGLMTATIRQGLKVIEYKTRKNLMLKSDQDLMLSRDIGELSQSQGIRYFLTGTLTEQENGVVVNARLIDTDNNQVVAAATDYVPSDVFWQTNKVKIKQNLIYRTSY